MTEAEGTAKEKESTICKGCCPNASLDKVEAGYGSRWSALPATHSACTRDKRKS
jgi:hypothetical protein